MEDSLFYQGGARHLGQDDLEKIISDIVDVSLYRKVRGISVEPTKPDKSFSSNEEFWNHVLSNKAYPDQIIKLKNFCVTEWIPASPGLFHTRDARYKREDALDYVARRTSLRKLYRNREDFRGISNDAPYLGERYLAESDRIRDRVAVELDPRGKMSMVLGGIGALRMTPKIIFEQKRFILGASSSGVCHEGIPLILRSDLYRTLIEGIKENCAVIGNIIGRLEVLPTENSPIEYERLIPKYCVIVEDFVLKEHPQPEDIIVSVTITFSPSVEEYNRKQWSFVSYSPDANDRQLNYAVEWLQDYAVRYSSSKDPLVLGDFDEFKRHFDKVEFPISEITNGNISISELKKYNQFLDIKITKVMGDYFNNIQNSTIINKSTVEKAFNKVKENHDEYAAKALLEVSEHVDKSGNEEAGELLDSFNEELNKDAPKKSLLKSTWNGLVTALPSISKIVGITEKIATLFS